MQKLKGWWVITWNTVQKYLKTEAGEDASRIIVILENQIQKRKP